MAWYIKDMIVRSTEGIADFEKEPWKAQRFSPNTFFGCHGSTYFILFITERDCLNNYNIYDYTTTRPLKEYHIKIASSDLRFLEEVFNETRTQLKLTEKLIE